MSKYTLEQLLGSRIRVKILRFLFRNELAVVDARSLAKRIQETTAATSSEIKNLTTMRLLKRRR